MSVLLILKKEKKAIPFYVTLPFQIIGQLKQKQDSVEPEGILLKTQNSPQPNWWLEQMHSYLSIIILLSIVHIPFTEINTSHYPQKHCKVGFMDETSAPHRYNCRLQSDTLI